MISFSCKFVGTDGKACPGHVSYKAAPVEMVSFIAGFQLDPELAKSIPDLHIDQKLQAAITEHNHKHSKKPPTEPLHTKRIYLTCDAEGMHVEPYDIPSKS